MIIEAVRGNRSRGQTAVSVPIKPPTLGWVTQVNMLEGKRGTAVTLDNWFPLADTVRVRGGFAVASSTGTSAKVETLMAYHKADGSRKLFAAAGSTLYDATNSVASSVATGLGNARWQHVNFATPGGAFLWCCNGLDAERYYDGSTWTNAALTGIASGECVNVSVFKSRLYFVLKNSLRFGYLPVQSIAGAVATFDLGSEFSKGGYLVAIATWTIDGGAGQDDHAVFLTSEGQVAIYQGSNPSDPNQWQKVGVYDLPRPIGRRCVRQVGGDVYLITEAGVVPLKDSLILDTAAANNIAVTKNIQQAMVEAGQLYKGNFGWQIATWPKMTMALLNVPLSEGAQQHQYVMNTVTGAWCRFTGQNANCWEAMGDRLFFGGNDGKVYEANVSASDNGADILADMKLSFDYFGSQALRKQWKMLQPLIRSDGAVQPAICLNVDFDDRLPTTAVGAANLSTIRLDGFNLDAVSFPQDAVLSKNWITVTDPPGYAAAVRMRVAANGTGQPITLQVNGFNLIYERGSML